MNFLFQICVLSAAILAVFGATSTFKVSTSEQDYSKRAQADLLVEIQLAENELATFNARFDDRFAVVQLQQAQSLNETQQVNQTLISLQVLSYARKYCIQKYDPQFVKYEDAQNEFEKCNYAGRSKRINSYNIPRATSLLKEARNYALVDFPYSSRSCDSYTNQTLLQNCYIATVQQATEVIHGFMNSAQKSLEMSYFDMEDVTQELVSCSFDIIKDVHLIIKATNLKIDNCVDEMDNHNNSPARSGKNLITA